MSLSNTDNEQFEKLTVSSLEAFNEELSNKTDESEPDFDRFKLLVEKPKFDEDEDIDFKEIYEALEETEEVIFKPLIKPKAPPQETGEEIESSEDAVSEQEPEEPEEPEETPEEKGFREGFEKGLEQGEQKGLEQGYDKGFEQGKEEGLEQGKIDGLEQGKEEGFEQGSKEGQETAYAETKKTGLDIINFLQETLEKTDQTLDQIVETYEERIIQLIQQICEKAVLAKVELDQEIVRPMILDTLKSLVQPEEVTLSVSQDDYQYIEMVKDEFFEQVESLKSVSVLSDPSIQKGGCRIETNTASVASDAQSRLEAIFNAMKNPGE